MKSQRRAECAGLLRRRVRAKTAARLTVPSSFIGNGEMRGVVKVRSYAPGAGP
jgi:hypothetical protein